MLQGAGATSFIFHKISRTDGAKLDPGPAPTRAARYLRASTAPCEPVLRFVWFVHKGHESDGTLGRCRRLGWRYQLTQRVEDLFHRIARIAGEGVAVRRQRLGLAFEHGKRLGRASTPTELA